MNDETDIELPQALIDRLSEQDHAVKLMTPKVDNAIAAAAQAQFIARSTTAASRNAPDSTQPVRRTSTWAFATAAAAALVFVVVAVRDPALPGDYDRSGSVDVLDALLLSREQTQDPRFAANESVDSLMQRIVALDAGIQ